ncbi:hypothetical protein FPRO06_11702 [Fusarium proliferatum]|nr:hypothetical protein FPRO06_11702 [Fusarium proliferatum]
MQFNLQRLPQRNPLVWGYRRNWCKPRSDPEHYLRLTLNEVTSAFVLTAWMVVVVLIGYYLKVYDPRLDPFRKEGTQKATKYPNSIDFAVHEILQSLPWPKHDSKYLSAQSSRLGTVLNACVLTFADVQIFTSLAILISAYTSVGCDIVAYHWQYMIYLAWLASVTHLASLSFLRNHLANNPAKRTWRLVAMCIIQVMLSVAVGLSMTFDGDPWLDSQGGRPAICYFKERIDTTSIAFQSAIKFIILIVWGLAIRIAKTFEGLEGGLRRIASLLEELLSLFTSLLAEVYWLFFTIIWITTRLVKLRVPSNQDDSKWTFGQVLPIILLIAPLALAIEAFYSSPKAHEPINDLQEIPGSNSDIRELYHIHSPAYRGTFFLAVLSYIEIAVYFVLDQAETQGIATPLFRILTSIFVLQPTLQASWSICNLWLDKMTWSILSVFALEAWAEKKHISKRMAFLVRSIFLLGLSLSCLILKPLPLSRLDWAIAGTTVSTKIPDPEGNLTSHSTFHQWISSRTLDSDAGFMYPQPNDLTLEKGSMVNPDTGIDTAYEELWHDATPTAVPGEPAVRALVLQTEDEKNGVRGSVVRLGCYAQGLIRVGEHISLERWEWKDGWKRAIRMGDAELPIQKILGEEALREGDTVDVGGREWKVIEESGKDASKL